MRPDLRSIAAIDSLETWDDHCPILGDAETPDENGDPRLKLSVAGLYWAVKRLAAQLLEDCKAEQDGRHA